MIVLTCVCIPNPGHEEESKAAARELTAASQSHGMIDYYWTMDEDNENLHVIEVHDDEASVLNHIALSDTSRLAAAVSFADIKLFGDRPSPALLEALSGFGDYKVYPTL